MFVTAIIILACVVAWQMSSNIGIRILWMALFVGAIFLQRASAPTPGQLVSIDFLQNNFANLHLSPLFDCSRLHINFGRMLGSDDPLAHFSIYQRFMFLRYKFVMAISDQECSRVYFVAYGQMDTTVNFQQEWTPEIQDRAHCRHCGSDCRVRFLHRLSMARDEEGGRRSYCFDRCGEEICGCDQGGSRREQKVNRSARRAQPVVHGCASSGV